MKIRIENQYPYTVFQIVDKGGVEVEVDDHVAEELKALQLQGNQLNNKLQRKLHKLYHGDS